MRQISLVALAFCMQLGATAYCQVQRLADPAVPNKSQAISNRREDLQQRRAVFASARELLLRRGVPFDPDELLDSRWRQRLKGALDAMPEMKQVRYETAPLAGVYLSDTLYLPEKASLASDTVIITRHLVFEGKNPVIKGPHALYVFQVLPPTVLGTSLPDALKKAGWSAGQEGGPLPSFALIQRSLTLEPHRIEFDVSGLPAGEKQP